MLSVVFWLASVFTCCEVPKLPSLQSFTVVAGVFCDAVGVCSFGLHVLLWHVIVTIAATSRIRELPLLVIRCPFCDYHHCHHHHQRLCEHYVVSSVLARLCFCML